MYPVKHIWTILMLKILQAHHLWAFVANLKIDAIYALYPESFCGKNLAIQKVFAFSDSEQDPVSTMQKTGWTNNSAFQSGHSSSLVWFGPVWCGLAVGVDHLDAVTNHLLVYLAILVWWIGNWQKNSWTKCNPALDRWPVRRQPFAMM